MKEFPGILRFALSTGFLLLCLPGSILSDPTPEKTAEEKISVNNFVELATKNDPAFQSILVDELALKYNQDLELPVSDFVLDATAGYYWNPNRKGGLRRGSTIGDVSLSKLFPSTGTSLSAGYTVNRTSNPDGTDSLTGSLTAQVSQSILENAFGNTTRKTARRIGLENEIARHQIIEAYEDYFASLIQIYENWLSAYENMKTARQSLSSAGELVAIVRRKRAARIAFPEELDRIYLEYTAAKENLILAEQEYDTLLNQIQSSLGKDYETRSIVPVPIQWDESFVALNSEELEKILEESRTFRITKLLTKRGLLLVDIAEDGLLPSASLFAGARMAGNDYRMTSTDRRAFAGITFSMNFGNQVERATYESSRVELKKTEFQNRSSLLTLRSDLKSLNRKLDQGTQLLGLAKEKARLAKRVYQAERKNYGIGKTDLNYLIQARDDVIATDYQITARLVELHRLKTEWLRLSDQLVRREEVMDRLPGLKAPVQLESETRPVSQDHDEDSTRKEQGVIIEPGESE